MKKLLLIAFSFLTFANLYGQNDGIDFKFVHAAQGKDWIRMDNPDGIQVPDFMKDDVFTFYSDGKFTYNEKKSSTARVVSNGETKKWAYNKTTNVLSWEITTALGEVKKHKAEITFVDEDRMVMNLSENGEENTIFILVKK